MRLHPFSTLRLKHAFLQPDKPFFVGTSGIHGFTSSLLSYQGLHLGEWQIASSATPGAPSVPSPTLHLCAGQSAQPDRSDGFVGVYDGNEADRGRWKRRRGDLSPEDRGHGIPE